MDKGVEHTGQDLNLKYRDNLVLFDGVCLLCNASVNFVIDRDKHKKFKFLSLQSDTSKALLAQHEEQAHQLESIVLIKEGKILRKSSAVLEIVRGLDGLWPVLYGVAVIPRPFRDWVYDFIARNRYDWFGKTDQCRIPTADLRERFVEDISG